MPALSFSDLGLRSPSVITAAAPTDGFARNFSGLGVDQFMRQMTVQELSREGLESLGDAVVRLASLEGLDAHAAAVTRRLESAQ